MDYSNVWAIVPPDQRNHIEGLIFPIYNGILEGGLEEFEKACLDALDTSATKALWLSSCPLMRERYTEYLQRKGEQP